MKRYQTISRIIAATGTTGSYVGRAARGGIVLPRGYYVEAMQCHAFLAGTTTNTKFRILVYKNGTTTVGKFVNGSAAKQCTTTGFKSITGTIGSAALTSSHRIWFGITNHTAGQSKISVSLKLREN